MFPKTRLHLTFCVLSPPPLWVQVPPSFVLLGPASLFIMRFLFNLFGPHIDILSFFGLGALVVYLIHRSIRRSRLQYFPGPKGIPILGNALQLGAFPWLQLTKWSEEFGKSQLSIKF